MYGSIGLACSQYLPERIRVVVHRIHIPSRSPESPNDMQKTRFSISVGVVASSAIVTLVGALLLSVASFEYGWWSLFNWSTSFAGITILGIGGFVSYASSVDSDATDGPNIGEMIGAAILALGLTIVMIPCWGDGFAGNAAYEVHRNGTTVHLTRYNGDVKWPWKRLVFMPASETARLISERVATSDGGLVHVSAVLGWRVGPDPTKAYLAADELAIDVTPIASEALREAGARVTYAAVRADGAVLRREWESALARHLEARGLELRNVRELSVK